jgi:hypothetical protein
MSDDPRELAVARLDEVEVRARVSAGDLSDFDDLALDDEQREALLQLAEEFGDVAGFGMDVFTKFMGGLDPVPFKPRLSTANQVSEVKVRGYDPTSKKEIVGRSDS